MAISPKPRFDQVEQELAKFVVAGRGGWRATVAIDVPLLVSLPAVQTELSGLGADVAVDANAERDAVEAAIDAVIKTLPDPFRPAALDYFGFANDAATKEKREKLAIRHFGRSKRWFGTASAAHLGRRPDDYLVALVAAGLCGAPDPVAALAEGLAAPDPVPDEHGDGASDPAGEHPERAGRSRRRTAQLLSGVAISLLVAAGLIIYLAAHRGKANAQHRDAGRTTAARAIFTCTRDTKCLGPAHPVFNAYSDAPRYGDERDFLNVRPARSSTSAWTNELSVKRNERVLLRVYYDNDGDPRSEPSPGASTAHGVRAAVLLPDNRAGRLVIGANITATNSLPRTVGDSAALISAKPINLVYVPGTARLWNQAHRDGFALPNALLDYGTPLGYKTMNGILTGCFCQAGLITLEALIE